MHAEDIEEIPGNTQARDLFRIASSGHIKGFGGEGRHCLEGAIAGLHLLEARVRQRTLPGVEAGGLRGQQHQARGLGVRQRL